MSYKPLVSLRNVVKAVRKGESVSRRDLLVGSAEGAAGIAADIGLSYLFGACSEEGGVSFSSAQQNYKLRQSYIDHVVKSDPPPTSVPISYRHDINYLEFPLFPDLIIPMYTESTIIPMSSRRESIKTDIFRSAFENYNEDEFLSSLLDHEYVHIRQAILGLEIGNIGAEIIPELQSRILSVGDPTVGDLFQPFTELEAFYNQIRGFPKRSIIRDSFKDRILEIYRRFRSLVESKERTPLTSWILERYPISP